MSFQLKKWSVLLLAAGTGSAFAATPPDAGSLLESVKNFFVTQPKAAETAQLINAPVEPPAAMVENDKLSVRISKVRITGNTTVPESVLLDLIKDDYNKVIGFNDMTRMAGILTKYYRDKGYFVARVYIPEQALKNETLELMVLEGKLADIKINFKTEGPQIPEQLMRDFVYSPTPMGRELTVQNLERSMLLLNEIPKTVATSTLVPGQATGSSDMVLDVEQSGRFANTTFSADNYGSVYTGANRFGANTTIASPLGWGDQLTLRALTSLGNFNYLRGSWSTPYGGSGLKLGLDLTYNNYKLGGPFEPSGTAGSAQVVGAMQVYPIIRQRFVDLYQSATLEQKTLSNHANAGDISAKKINVLNLGLNGNETDSQFGTDGLSNYSVTWAVGNVDLSGNATDQANDLATAQTAGGYQKLSFQANRQQQLFGDWVLYGSIMGQVSNKNLDSSESMSFGGANGVRAYPVGEGSADKGYLASLELRYNTVAPMDLGSLQYQLFYDYAAATAHTTTWSGFDNSGIKNDFSLSAFGVGANVYKPNKYLVSASVARKIGSNPNPGMAGADADGATSDVRAWLQLTMFY